MSLVHVIVVQNKIDIVSKERAIESYNEIKEFVKGTCAEDALIIPVSAQQGANMDILIENMLKQIQPPERKYISSRDFQTWRYH